MILVLNYLVRLKTAWSIMFTVLLVSFLLLAGNAMTAQEQGSLHS